jgi:hypothetical protein
MRYKIGRCNHKSCNYHIACERRVKTSMEIRVRKYMRVQGKRIVLNKQLISQTSNSCLSYDSNFFTRFSSIADSLQSYRNKIRQYRDDSHVDEEIAQEVEPIVEPAVESMTEAISEQKIAARVVNLNRKMSQRNRFRLARVDKLLLEIL